MIRAILTFVVLAGATAGLLLYAPPMVALLALGGIGLFVVTVAALTSAFHKPAEGRDRLLGA